MNKQEEDADGNIVVYKVISADKFENEVRKLAKENSSKHFLLLGIDIDKDYHEVRTLLDQLREKRRLNKAVFSKAYINAGVWVLVAFFMLMQTGALKKLGELLK